VARKPGFHYKKGPEGVLAIEADSPYPGVVTVTWIPEGGGKRTESIIPNAIFAPVALEYVKRLASGQPTEKPTNGKNPVPV
jgi:hypothetical protein